MASLSHWRESGVQDESRIDSRLKMFSILLRRCECGRICNIRDRRTTRGHLLKKVIKGYPRVHVPEIDETVTSWWFGLKICCAAKP